MKRFIFAGLLMVGLVGFAQARGGGGYHAGGRGYGTGSNSHSTSVGGYTKSNGTHVDTYHRTENNSTDKDNYSTKGNYNPWTGASGTKKSTDGN